MQRPCLGSEQMESAAIREGRSSNNQIWEWCRGGLLVNLTLGISSRWGRGKFKKVNLGSHDTFEAGFPSTIQWVNVRMLLSWIVGLNIELLLVCS